MHNTLGTHRRALTNDIRRRASGYHSIELNGKWKKAILNPMNFERGIEREQNGTGVGMNKVASIEIKTNETNDNESMKQ